MNTDLPLRILCCLAFGIAAAIGVRNTDRSDRNLPSKNPRQRFQPYMAPYILLAFCLTLCILQLAYPNMQFVKEHFLPILFHLFFHLSVYNSILLILLKPLRNRYSARVCGFLWLLPNYLYIAYSLPVMLDRPLWILPLPFRTRSLTVILWLLGFMGTLGYHIIMHLILRKKLLKDSVRITELRILRIFRTVLDEGRFKYRKYQLYRCSRVTTPLSIGLLKRYTCILLPDREYTDQELRLILQHELVHIGRKDSLTKFYMVFCAAILWFNPLSWIAVKRCSEDLELSCDETVLLGEDPQSKELYAQLLLRTAADDRGFTTCLSGTGKTMLYRLRAVTASARRPLGALIAGISMFLLLASFGLTGFSYNPVSGDELPFAEASGDYSLFCIVEHDGEIRTDYNCTQTEALTAYLSDLEFYRLTVPYRYRGDTYSMSFCYNTPQGITEVHLSDHRINIYRYWGGKPSVESYYHNNSINWQLLLQIADSTD